MATIYNITKKECVSIHNEKDTFTFAELIKKGWTLTDKLVCVEIENTKYNLFDDGGDENKRLMVNPHDE